MKKSFWVLMASALLFSCSMSGNAQPSEPAEEEVPATMEGQWKLSMRKAWADAYENKLIKIGSHTMKIWWTVFGEAPSDGRSLYISLHGGGGAPAEVNDQQWENQKRLYQPAEGVYLCPRAITNTWDLHFVPEADAFYEAIIQMAVAYLGVNPNKVYLMGYSAGGDGVWRLAPRMADHWAAASMMAGHPGDVSLLGLRNLPFMIWCGALDAAYDRNKECAARIEEMDALQAADPEGYIHEGHIVEGREHWMYLEDAAAVPWMAKFVRNPYPTRVVWCQGDVNKEYFYWLGIPLSEAAKGKQVIVEVKDNVITIQKCDYSGLRLYLNSSLADFSKPVKVVTADGTVLFEEKVSASEDLLKSTLLERNDLAYSFPAMISVRL